LKDKKGGELKVGDPLCLLALVLLKFGVGKQILTTLFQASAMKREGRNYYGQSTGKSCAFEQPITALPGEYSDLIKA
jgi:hypothetical protein